MALSIERRVRKSEAQRRIVSTPSLVLASALAFLSGVRFSNSVCELLHGTGLLPRSGELACRSLLHVRNLC
jgi:hypothetical protein